MCFSCFFLLLLENFRRLRSGLSPPFTLNFSRCNTNITISARAFRTRPFFMPNVFSSVYHGGRGGGETALLRFRDFRAFMVFPVDKCSFCFIFWCVFLRCLMRGRYTSQPTAFFRIPPSFLFFSLPARRRWWW